MLMTEAIPEGLWQVDARAYHADRSAVSHSALEVFRESVPLYHGRYITGTIKPPPQSAAMVLGSAFETVLLEPERFYREYALAPKVDRRTKNGKSAWSLFSEHNTGKTILDYQTNLSIFDMLQAVQANLEITILLGQKSRRIQQSIRWTDPDTGLALKCRPDVILPDCLIDLKTATNPLPAFFTNEVAHGGWVTQAHNLGYHRQAAMYLDGTGRRNQDFLFIVVGSTPPYETAVYRLDSESIELGRQQYKADLKELARRLESGDWSGVTANRTILARLPNYAFLERDATNGGL